ncbi:MAG TPA: oligogalacturonate lyase family protein [Bryobacteraceae bacterium]|nr:oligogalacturonate lyase family protein [Bryobacteraceae bacterium]
MDRRALAALSRRSFLVTVCAALPAAEIGGKGRVFPSFVKRFADPATENPILRLTDPAHTSFLPPSYARAFARRGNFLLYTSNQAGGFEAFRLDLKNGQSRQLTASEDFDVHSFTLFGEDRYLAHFDGSSLLETHLANLRTREIYRIPEGFERGRGLGVSEDSQFAAVIEKKEKLHRLQLVHIGNGSAAKLAEGEEELRDPIPRPRRASILYRRGSAAWLANYDGGQNYRLKLAEGQIGPALWSPDGRTVLYLNYPSDPHQLHAIREFTPDTNEDKLIAETSQYVAFAPNADASVFVGASGSKASPYVLLLVRAVGREMTLAEHRASNAAMVAPIFSADSQRVFYVTDRDGKPAIYSMSVARLVEETASAN